MGRVLEKSFLGSVIPLKIYLGKFYLKCNTLFYIFFAKFVVKKQREKITTSSVLKSLYFLFLFHFEIFFIAKFIWFIWCLDNQFGFWNSEECRWELDELVKINGYRLLINVWESGFSCLLGAKSISQKMLNSFLWHFKWVLKRIYYASAVKVSIWFMFFWQLRLH